MTNEIPENEQARLAALAAYHILDTATEQDYEELTELAAAICDTPIALISLVDGERQWFKSHRGLDIEQTHRSQSFCAHAIQAPKELMQVEDAHQDDRFKDNPLVTGHPDITFYAGMPLVDEQGFALGSICVIDHQPRVLNDSQQKALRTLAKQVVNKLTLRKKVVELESSQTANAVLHEQHRISERNLRSVIEQSPAAIIIFRGPHLCIEAANPPMLELLDQQPDIVGQPLLQAIPELEGQPACNLLYEIYRSGEPVYGYDTPVQLKRNGQIETGYFNFTYTPLMENGEVVGIIDMAVEVTEQVRARLMLEEREQQLRTSNEELARANGKLMLSNRQLREAEDALQKLNQELILKEARLQNILDIIGEGIGITDEKGNIVYTNQRNREIFKVDEQRMLELNNASPIWGNRRLDGTPLPNEEHPVTVAISTGHPVYNFEFIVQDNQQHTIYLRMNATPIKSEQGVVTGAIGSFADITVSYLLQQQFKEKEESLKMAIASANLGTFHLSAQARTFVPSPRLKELFGYKPDEDMPYEAAITQIAETHRAKVLQAVEDSVIEGDAYDIEYPIIGFHDRKLRWVRATGKLYTYPGETKPAHFSGTLADITERKLDEQRRSDFIGMVSHELRNPLTAMNGYVQMLEIKAKKSEDQGIAEVAAKAKRQVERMRALITGFLEVARLGEGKIQLNLKPFDMAALVKIAEEESLATITSHQVVFHPVEFTPVEADQDKIEQVLVNFINNAVKYSTDGSTINVSCITRDGWAHVSVADEGMGISVKDQPHVFERFYRVESEKMKTTKGFGIGLYICKEIIDRHQGQIGVESVEGHGSSFWFSLPIHQ